MIYKVETCKIKKAEALMNKYASEGWEVINVCTDNGMESGVVITFGKK